MSKLRYEYLLNGEVRCENELGLEFYLQGQPVVPRRRPAPAAEPETRAPAREAVARALAMISQAG